MRDNRPSVRGGERERGAGVRVTRGEKVGDEGKRAWKGGGVREEGVCVERQRIRGVGEETELVGLNQWFSTLVL